MTKKIIANTKKLKRNYNIKMSHGIFRNKPLLFTMIIVAMVITASTFMYSQIAGLDRQILSTKHEINELKKTKMTLSGGLKGIKSQIEVADIAMYKLGMVYPDDWQIVYIDTKTKKPQGDVNYNVFLSPIVSVLRSFQNE